MVVHNELRPDPGLLPLTVAEKAMRIALTAQTRNAGSLYIPNPNGDDLIFGESAEDGANWVDGDGNQSPLVDTEFFKQGIEQANQEITAVNGRLDQMDAEAEKMQEHINSVRREAQENFETAKAAADAAAERADTVSQEVADFRTEVNETVQTVKDSVSDVQSDVDAVTRKAADLASELDGTKATVEQVVTEQGEIKTTVSNAVEKADQSLQVSTQASQTATQAQTTATSAYEDAQTAITQSSQATQTANQVSLDLRTNYQTKADADAKYATQASLTATSEQIRTEVSETYATQATVNALENLANNAVQTWMGDGVPTLSNKPASDWTTNELRKQHSGDLYYDTDTGYSYRFGSNDGANYSWALVKDTDITKALADAAKAQETAEGAQSGVNELKTSIPVTYATKSELSQKADSITARVEEVAQAGETTSNKVAELELTADGLQTTVKEQASKIDRNATTISQVSQKADSLSSTITQVSGRVDDVDAKADTAQETANSAMSQASRVEQSLDSFKTSVSRDYQTKTDALSQKSELEQNINSFKTTVSETYTTKDEFNALEIGGTNLARNTNQASSKWAWQTASGNATKESVDVNGITAIKLTNNVSSASWQYFSYSDVDVEGMEPDSEYTVSFDILASGFGKSLTIQAGLQNGDGTSNIAPYKTLGVISDDVWSTLSAVLHTRSDIKPIDQDLYCTGLALVPGASVTLKNLKIEKGNKPTAWSPAPEDFDGKYTSKTEFEQTTDKISATATAASQNASSALSKVGSLEVSVNGIDAKVEENASDIADAVKTTSQVSQRVDSLSSTITQVSKLATGALAQQYLTNPDFETGDTTGWDFQGFANVVVNNANPNTGTYKVYVQPDGSSAQYIFNNKAFPVSPGQRYRISLSMNTDTASTHPMNFGLVKAGYTSLSDSVYFTKNPSGIGYLKYEIVSGTVTIPSGWTKAQFRFSTQDQSYTTMRMDSFQIIDVSDGMAAQDTANSALSKSSSVEQSLNSFKTSVSQTYETKSDATSKQSSLQQSVNNLRTEVSQTYTTKTDVANNYTPKIVAKNVGTGGTTGWFRVAQFKVTTQYSNAAHRVTVSNRSSQQTVINIQMASVNSIDPGLGILTKSGPAAVAMAKSATSTWILYVQKSESYDSLTVTSYEAPSYNPLTVTWLTDQVSAPPSGYKTATNLIGWKNETDYSTKSYVDQTSRTVSLGVVEEYKNGQHGSALATASDITATKNSITSTVSQTYLSKNDASAQYATKTQVQQTSDSLTVKINESVSLTRGSVLVTNGDFETGTTSGWTFSGFNAPYVNTTNAYTGSYKLVAPISGNGNHNMVNNSVIPVYQGQKYRFRCALYPDNTISNELTIGFIGDDGTLITNLVPSVTGGGWHVYNATLTVPSGVKSMRARIATNNNGFANLRVDSVTVTDVTEGANAQSTANTANTNATNANNRVGNLETCIKMTTQGVRVGKVSNGNFTGYSALVNSGGSFDVLNGDTTVTRFAANSISIPSSNNGNSDARLQLTSAGYDLAFTRNGTTYYFRLGSGGIGIHAPDGSYVDVGSGGIAVHAKDGSYMDLSSGKGLTLETKTLGRLSIGSGGLEFTNDQSWGFQLSVTGWSINWAGNHRLATGDEPGALYIDGRKIQVV